MRGRYDADASALPLAQVVTHGALRVGFLEGFTAVAPAEMDLLLAEANKLDVDVLCWGGTHRFDAYEYEGKFFVNPGSATGAFVSGWVGEGEGVGEMVPSFCLMDVSLRPCSLEGFGTNIGVGPRNWFDALCVPAKEG